MGEQALLVVGDTSFRGSDPAAAADHRALSLDRTCLRRDRPDERYLNSRVVEPTPFSKVD